MFRHLLSCAVADLQLTYPFLVMISKTCSCFFLSTNTQFSSALTKHFVTSIPNLKHNSSHTKLYLAEPKFVKPKLLKKVLPNPLRSPGYSKKDWHANLNHLVRTKRMLTEPWRISCFAVNMTRKIKFVIIELLSLKWLYRYGRCKGIILPLSISGKPNPIMSNMSNGNFIVKQLKFPDPIIVS